MPLEKGGDAYVRYIRELVCVYRHDNRNRESRSYHISSQQEIAAPIARWYGYFFYVTT